MSIYVLESTTVEKVPTKIKTSGDPTGNSPEFAITTDNTQPTTFSVGEWVGAWNETTGYIDALTPLAGAGQTLDTSPNTDYYLWARWDIGTETPTVHATGTLRIT